MSELTITYTIDANLGNRIYDLIREMASKADSHHCYMRQNFAKKPLAGIGVKPSGNELNLQCPFPQL